MNYWEMIRTPEQSVKKKKSINSNSNLDLFIDLLHVNTK